MAELSPGQIVGGKYQIEAKLGSGAMGAVYLATQTALARKVAIKVMLPAAHALPDADVRFLREARAAAALESEHAVQIIDTGRLDNGTPYFVMEHLDGEDLATHVRRVGALPVAEAVHYVIQACEAVAEAHSRGIIHRDIKPANVFLAKRIGGIRVVVLDFGLAKDMGGLGTGAFDSTGKVAVLGSPMYMAPEQLRAARDVDARVDVWALGVLLQETLTARPVFHAETITALSAMIAADPAPLLRSFRPDTPEALEVVISKCLEKDPSKRYPSVTELANALAPFSETRVSQPSTRPPALRVIPSVPPTSKPPDVLGATVFASGEQSTATTSMTRKKRRAPPIYLLLVAVIVVGGGLFVWREMHRTQAVVPPTPTPSVSASSPPAVTSSEPPIEAGTKCKIDHRPALAIPGTLQFATIAGAGAKAAVAVRSFVMTDGGRRLQTFVGSADAAGATELHDLDPLMMSSETMGVAASHKGSPRFVIARNHTALEDRGSAIAILPLSGVVTEPGAAISSLHFEVTDIATASYAHRLVSAYFGRTYDDPISPNSPPTNRALLIDVGSGPQPIQTWPVASKDPPRAPAVAVGRDGIAIAYRTDHNVQIAWLTDAPEIEGQASVGTGEVGAPAMAIDDLMLYAVWAQRARSTEAYRLRWTSWKKHDPAPATIALLDTGFASAMAPAIAIAQHRFALAWMEEEDGKSRVKVGVGSTIEEAAKSGILASHPEVNARDPEITALGNDFAMIWIEEPTPKGEAYVGIVSCK